MEMSKIAVAVIGLAVGAGASAIYAQSTAPYYEVVEINVKDQTNYEKSGVDKVRESMKANGGKIIAGGYNKATTIMGAAPANRFLVIQYPSKEGSDKTNVSVKAWYDSEGHKYSDLRSVGVESVEQK
jgi:uncharacterized protein (DUF1330 family)